MKIEKLVEELNAAKYRLTEDQAKRLEKDFTYHPPKGDQAKRYEMMREAAGALALIIMANTPVSREQMIALTHLDAVVFNANAAIARNE